ncbi:small acid-soluble spore protein P [Paenibacillus harenae]|uniref:Small acid-soluble spore protein P (Minor) n=1 Tax=Paenibacillus harenae TaxID=306543 RepID=A0ABT9UC73_PAEHA|nr:small acid-soluble spore protein P [Paenibacillus harenae]MDQ0063914.1 small acid-soluble spore protein P (minor) [Paenibacillus harenae]MDQ0116305.1 small acid-soluble spore protein P (minor) [Paenibacillus harenae]
MSKPESYPVPEANPQQGKQRSGGGQQKPLSGSKKTKQQNHVSHNNPEG